MNRIKWLLTSIVLAFSGQVSAAVIPYGVQTNTGLTTVQDDWGWTECYSGAGTDMVSLSSILSGCQGDYLMMAAYRDGSDSYDILAAAEFDDVLFDTGRQDGSNDVTHTANGAEWYFNDDWSWGFTELGNSVDLNTCDVNLSFAYGNNTGMCWHTENGSLTSGWALNAGSGMSFLYQGGWNRVLLVADRIQVSEPHLLVLFLLGAGAVVCSRGRRQV